MPGFTGKTWKGSRNYLLNSSLSSYSCGRTNSINFSYSDAIRYRSHPNICEIASLSRRSSDSNGVLKMEDLLSNNLVLEEGQTYKAYVSHIVENELYTFFLQLGDSQEILIPSIKRSLEDTPRKPVSGMIFPGMCLVCFNTNPEPRRCIITEVYNFGCKVFFCDYGSTGEIPFAHLYHVSHEAAQIKPQAIKFTLANTASLPDDPRTFDYLKSVILGAHVQITIVGSTSHPTLYCDMEFKGCDVKEMILNYLAPIHYLPQILLSSDDTKVFVTHVESASKFYVQYASNLKLIESIQHSLHEIYSNSVDEEGPCSIPIGSPVAVFDEEDNCWARGLISEKMSNYFYVIKVDFGNTIKVKSHHIRDIRKRSLVENFRSQSIECGLYDFEEDNSDLIWNNVITKLVPKNVYTMVVLAAKPHHLSVDLHDEKGESITTKIKIAHKQAINGHGVASSDVQAMEVKLSVQAVVHQPMVPNVLSYNFLNLKEGDDILCYFVTLISPNEIYVQLSDSETELNSIEEIISSVSLSKLPSDQVALHQPVVSLFADDGNYYRAIVTNISHNQVTLTYVDYGNASIVNDCDLFALPEELKKIPPQAINVRFQNLPAVGDSEDLVKYQAVYESLDAINFQIKSVEVSEGGLVVYADAPHEIFTLFQTTSETERTIDNGHNAAASSVEQQIVHHPTEPDLLSYNFLNLKEGDDIVCYFVTLISPNEIYVQLSDSETELNSIEEIISSVSLSKLPSDRVALHQPVVSLFADDGNYYRAIVTNISHNQVTLTYVDYGNASIVNDCDLFALPEELKKIPPRAINVRFQNLPAVGDSEDLVKYQAVYESLDAINLQIKSVEVSEGGLVVYADAPHEIFTLFQTTSETGKTILSGHDAPASSDEQQIVHYPTEPNLLSYKFLNLKEGDDIVCYFVTLISPNEIYVQLSDSETELNSIEEIISSVSLSKLPSDQVALHQPVVSLFADDGNYYRAIVTNISHNQVTLTYVDYGNASIVNDCDLFALPEELKKIPPQAINVRFQNLPAVGDSEDLVKYQAVYESLDAINFQIKSVEVSEGGLVVYADAPEEILLNFQCSDNKEATVPVPAEVKEDPFALCNDDLGAEKFNDESFSEEDEIVTIKELGSNDPVFNENSTGIYLDSSNLDYSTFTENLELLRGQHFLVTLLSVVDNVNFIVKIHAIDLIMLVKPVNYYQVPLQFIIYVLDVMESSLVVDVYDVVGKHLGKGASISPVVPRPVVKREEIVFVSHYEGDTIYITRDEDREKLDILLNETYNYYDHTPEADVDWIIGELCCAKASDDNWYRAIILETGSEFKVKFIDYGNSEFVPKMNLRELSHRFFCEPELCVEIKLPIVLNENAEYDSTITNGTFKTLFYKKEGATWICDLTQDDVLLSSKLDKKIKCVRPEYLPERMPVGWNFQVSETHKAYVTTVHSIDSFYVQLEDDIPRLHMLQRSINNFNGVEPIGEVFAALYDGDGSWYRAVDAPNGVHFIDYGNVETTKQTKSIPYECTFPAEGLALLVNFCVRPVNGIWSSEAIEMFNQFIENRVQIKILSLLGKVVVDLISVTDSLSLSGILINSGHAKFTDCLPGNISDLIQKRSEMINNSLTLVNRSLPENELIGTKSLALVAFLNNVNDFYIQYFQQLEIMERLKEMLIHAQHFNSVKNFNVGDILCVQHTDVGHEGKVWYRGEIISKEPLRAHLLDYGLTVDVSDVRLLPLEVHNVPQLAVHCSLNIRPEKVIQNHDILYNIREEELIVNFHTKGKPHIVSLKDSRDIEVIFNK